MSTASKGRTIGYWVTTGVLAVGMAMGGVYDLMAPPEMAEAFEHLGYPSHLLTLLGIAKLLAVVTILVPKFERLKEWAYAGLVIDLVGAGWSHARVGDPFAEWAVVLVFLALVFASYFLRPADRRLPDRVRA